ncbi:hypothetical protein [uncultured Bdellovibrio sp.]|uniref:hypothetical protein n=1 Tax=Bdellovibrio sp. HCB-162 TaxID=3394234 RepID=UPI0025CC1C05|nr:hypothetical protein [uncultured Bdellovibrio sp.]
MKSSAFKLAGISSLLVLLSACQPINGNSLLTDQKDDPSANALDKAPKSEELYLKVFNPTIQATGLDRVEVSGECYLSTYPKHSIIVLRSGVQLNDFVVDINPTTANNTNSASCKNGRFNLALNTGQLAAGVHSLRFILQAWDANNSLVTNDAQGASNVTLSK